MASSQMLLPLLTKRPLLDVSSITEADYGPTNLEKVPEYKPMQVGLLTPRYPLGKSMFGPGLLNVPK
jgi:hypothetical protein